jgi:hypothetical protein
MLKEISDLSQTTDDLKRRWFSDGNIDLYVWYDNERHIVEFQISYNKDAGERILSWSTASGITCHGVDSGTAGPYKMKASPVMTEETRKDVVLVRDLVNQSGQKLEHDLFEFILVKLEY